MPNGDWGPGVVLRPVMFNATLDHEGHIAHCGVGYDVITPDGRVLAQSGHTWHCPGMEIHASPEDMAQLEALLARILRSAVVHEGAAGFVHPAPPRSLTPPGPDGGADPVAEPS